MNRFCDGGWCFRIIRYGFFICHWFLFHRNLNLKRLILRHVAGRYPDLAAVCRNSYIDTAILYSDFLTGQCTDVFHSVSGRKIHGSSIVIVIDCYNDTHIVQITCKCKLTVCKVQFRIASVT